MKYYFLLMAVILFTFSVLSFGQLDSIYHLGPSQGSQPTGALQNTDNFPNAPAIIPGGETRVIPNVDTRFNSEPLFIEVDESKLPEYVYIEDANAVPNASLNLNADGGSVLLNSFQGFTATAYIPPDPTMAVGPNHIIALVNGDYFRIFDKQGNIIKTINAGGFFAPVSPETSGDPQIIYDHFAGRWVMLWMQYNATNLTAANLVAYSDDDNPIGVWYVYRFDTKKHGSVQTNTWGDYPQLGFDDEAIYISTRIFSFGTGFFGMKFRVIKKSELYSSNGGPVTWWDFWDIRRPNANPPAGQILDGIHPTFSYTAGQGGYFFFANSGGGNFYDIYKIINPTSNTPRLRGKEIAVQFYYGSPNAGQLGGGYPLESNGSGIRTAPRIKDGKLYIAHSVGNSTSPTYTSAKYVILDLNTVTIEEQAELGAVGYFYIYPTLAVDESNNIGMTFTRSATTEYAGAYYSTKKAGDPPGLNPSEPIKLGLGNYQQVADDRNRWGDYMAIYLDPADNHGMFMHTEYANTGNSWATYIGHIIAAPYPGAHAFLQPGSIDFKDVETGTTSLNASIVLANFGNADLIITDIPSSFGDFNLESSLSFPITLTTYDSLALEFSYSPSTEGPATVVYPVTSNDTQFSGITLIGNGYNIVLASEKTFYASSGSQNSGNILTIDPVSGTGTNIGPSSFNEVTSLSINPLNGKIYGLVAGNGSADLVKVNAEEGDSYTMFTLNISLMAGIAFDTTGVLYGITRSGELYTIDLTNGATNMVVDAQGTYLGITFHPVTNELWATSRAVVLPNKDAIFKVDLSTGDTTIVGHTGLNKQTNCIAFDENLNLYGVIGSSAELNDFISIDSETGVGTIIGSTGLKHILGLTFIDEIISNIEDDKNSGSVPSAYALRQNYPNPFNPTTKIDFSLPVESDVKLVIYNILGQEVIQLINNQMTAGNHSVNWNANDAGGNQLTSGIYLYKLTASGINGNEFQDIKKMILLK